MHQPLIFGGQQIMEMHLKNKNKTQVLQIRALNMSKNHSCSEWLPPAVLVNVHLELCLCLFLMSERHLNKKKQCKSQFVRSQCIISFGQGDYQSSASSVYIITQLKMTTSVISHCSYKPLYQAIMRLDWVMLSPDTHLTHTSQWIRMQFSTTGMSCNLHISFTCISHANLLQKCNVTKSLLTSECSSLIQKR